MLEPAALAGAPNPQIQLPLLLKRAEDAAAAVSPRAGPAAMRRLLAPFRGGQQASSPTGFIEYSVIYLHQHHGARYEQIQKEYRRNFIFCLPRTCITKKVERNQLHGY